MDGNVSINKVRIRNCYLGLFIFKAGLGVALIVLGIKAESLDRGDNPFGPPYFIGAFVTGSLCTIAGLLSVAVSRSSSSTDLSSQYALEQLMGYIRYETGITYLATFSCIMGIIMVGISGFEGCDRLCNFSTHIEEHITLARFILIGLIAAILLGIFTVYLTCCSSLLYLLRKKSTSGILNRYVHNAGGMVPAQRQYISTTAGIQQQYVYPTATVTSSQHPDAYMRLEEENRRLREQLGQGNGDGFAAPPPCYSEVMHQTNETSFTEINLNTDTFGGQSFAGSTGIDGTTCGESASPSAPSSDPI